MVIIQILGNAKIAVKLISAVFLTLMGVTIALTGTWATWIAASFGVIVTFAAASPVRNDDRDGQHSERDKRCGERDRDGFGEGKR